MSTILDMLSLPFMQRAFITGMILGFMLAALGVLATLRKMAFFGEGVAHASLAGIAIAVLTGLAPIPVAIIWAIIVAILIFFLEEETKLSSDTSIGILFTTSMAAGVVLMNFSEGFQPELLSFLFGNILTITQIDVWLIAIAAVVIITWFFTFLRPLTLMSLSEETAQVKGIHVKTQKLLFYLALAIATVLGVKILGIILVSALIILPPSIARLYTNSFKSYVFNSIISAEMMIIIGLTGSYLLDVPSGASIVIAGATLFAFTSLLTKLAQS